MAMLVTFSLSLASAGCYTLWAPVLSLVLISVYDDGGGGGGSRALLQKVLPPPEMC